MAETRDHFFHARDPFLGGLMSEHRAADAIADGKDSRDVGLKGVVDEDKTAAVGGDADGFQSECAGVGDAARADQHAVGRQRLALAAADDARAAVGFGRFDPHPAAELEPLLGEYPFGEPRDLTVEPR